MGKVMGVRVAQQLDSGHVAQIRRSLLQGRKRQGICFGQRERDGIDGRPIARVDYFAAVRFRFGFDVFSKGFADVLLGLFAASVKFTVVLLVASM